MTNRYSFRESEQKWQSFWDKEEIFKASDIPTSKQKYYVLEMFPYPSGNIHMGHVRNYTLGDVVARYKRSKGFDVLHPMGWDAFGLPAENAAIENNVHPEKWTLQNIAIMREQLKEIGLSYDWNRELTTCLPDYYQHEQRFFLEMIKAGLAYRKEAVVNWDPIDNTVLANEQVVDGKGWRSGAVVERKTLSQWFLKITDVAEDLLDGLKELEGKWPNKVLTMQENWIGKSYGATISFDVDGGEDGEQIEVYTTRPDTIFGMSFCGISPDHPLSKKLAKDNPAIQSFIEECSKLGTSEEAVEKAEKRGVDTGLTVKHPFSDKSFPVYIANFVLMDYGTGAVFACPAHDQRDLDFARKYDLEVTPVIAPNDIDDANIFTIENEAYTGDGVAINSDFLNGMNRKNAQDEVINRLEKLGSATRKTNYRLRDWGISRQRYWGCPIPIIHCDDCGIVPVPTSQLPVELPKDVSFDKAGNPLDHHPTWKHTNCPTCNKPAIRETDTFDTFFESSWYFARFCSPKSEQGIDKASCDAWLPVDCYIGGVEHAVLHLLYSRFFTHALGKCGYLSVKEPFIGLMTQGMICHETYQDEDGKWLFPDDVSEETTQINTGKPVTVGRSIKMSKSKKNVIDPKHIIASYGADTARLFMLSDSPPERDLEWTDAGVDGAWRYVNRLWKLLQDNLEAIKDVDVADMPEISDSKLQDIRKKTHATIKDVGYNIEHFHFNKAVALIRELSNGIASINASDSIEHGFVMRESIESLIHLIAPFMPHLSEEMWAEIGETQPICLRPYPSYDESLLVEDTVTIAVQVNGKLRNTLELAKDIDKAEAEKIALADAKITEYVAGKQIRKVIVVPNRIINIVAA